MHLRPLTMIFETIRKIANRLRGRDVAFRKQPMLGMESKNLISDDSTTIEIDDDLFEKSLLLWQRGEWTLLAELGEIELSQTASRGKTAALVAAAHIQKNNNTSAANFIRLAKSWGCQPLYIAQVLTAGVYYSLTNTALLCNQNDRADRFAGKSLIINKTPENISALVKYRIEKLATYFSSALKSIPSDRPYLAQDVTSSTETTRSDSRTGIAEKNIESNEDEIKNLQLQIGNLVKTEITKATKQIEAFINIQHYLTNGEIVPELHGWPISPDIALFLIELLNTEKYDIVIEFGSGTSTYLIAKTIQRKNNSTHSKPEQFAFEHLPLYHKKTVSELAARNLNANVNVELSPLTSYFDGDGKEYLYYDCQKTLSTLASRIDIQHPKILLLVDGPPGSTGKHARYPALPIIISHFPGATIDVLLDDYDRKDEREVLKKWTEFLSKDFDYETLEKKFEKGACFLKAKRKQQEA